MLRHIVMFKPRKFATEAEKQEKLVFMKEVFEDLPIHIPQIKFYEVGINQIESEYMLVINSLFENFDELRTYQAHPMHQKAVEMNKEVSESKIVADYYI